MKAAPGSTGGGLTGLSFSPKSVIPKDIRGLGSKLQEIKP